MAYLRHLISSLVLEKRECIVIVFIIIIDYQNKIRRLIGQECIDPL